MGYCAKARILSHIICVIATISLLLSLCVVNVVHCANSKVPGKTYPNLKSYDIWGADTEADGDQHHTFTSSDDDVLLQDYGEKTSSRNGKGSFFSFIHFDQTLLTLFFWNLCVLC